MIHPIQFLDQYTKRGAAEYGVSVAEYRDTMDEHAALVEWMAESARWMALGAMSTRWWNAVRNHPIALAMVDQHLKHDPVARNKHGHDRAMAEVRYAKSMTSPAV